MLSYVVPSKDTQIIIPNNNSSAMTPHRNLSLNLSPQFPHKNNASDIAAYEPHELNNLHITNVADCDERTSLLSRISTPPPPPPPPPSSTSTSSLSTNQTARQNANNFNNNNNISNTANDSVDHFDETDACLENSLTMDSDQSYSHGATTATTTKKTKLSKLGTKSVGLKRVSFGSSKGSMVETLVFETPTPLSEKVEPTFAFESGNRQQKSQNSVLIGGRGNLDDSGIEAQEESERSIVRVSIYQSSKPQQICPPDFLTRFDDNLDESFNSYNCNLEDSMTTATVGYDRQQSTDSGWDNPFRPGGDLSREADEIVNMIRGGKPITPTEEHVIGNGNAQKTEEHCNGNAITETVNKTNVTQIQSAQNGTNSTNHMPASVGGKAADNNGVTSSSTTQVSKQVVPGPTSASHVVIDEKKNKKKGCCVLQ